MSKPPAPLFHRWELALDIITVIVVSATLTALALEYFDVLTR